VQSDKHAKFYCQKSYRYISRFQFAYILEDSKIFVFKLRISKHQREIYWHILRWLCPFGYLSIKCLFTSPDKQNYSNL